MGLSNATNRTRPGCFWGWPFGRYLWYDQHRSRNLIAILCRMATDLNLHRKTAVTSQDTQEGRTRDIEVHNRERTWILCFCLDRSFSAQMGKPSSIKEEYVINVFSWSIINARSSYIIRNSHEWYKSPVANTWDISISAYAVRILGLFLKNLSLIVLYFFRISNGYNPGVWSSCIAELNPLRDYLSIVTICWSSSPLKCKF